MEIYDFGRTDSAVVVVQARMGSTRLPGKMMMDLAGRPLLWHILQRARLVDDGSPVVLGTTELARDDPLVDVAAGLGMAVVRGSEDDVMGRFLKVLESYPARWVVRICGDSPLFDPGHLGRCLELARREEADVVRFREAEPTLLQGGEVVSARALWWSREVAPDDPLCREHVTAYALENASRGAYILNTVYVEVPEGMEGLAKLSVDTEEDMERMRLIYDELWNRKGILDLGEAVSWVRGSG